jgi:hypothetical protein
LEIIIEGGGLAVHFRGEAHSFVCFAGVVEESGKCSETALSLAADDVFGNYWWYAFNTNVYFRGYINVATLTFVHNARKWMLLCAEPWELRGLDLNDCLTTEFDWCGSLDTVVMWFPWK